MVTMIIPQPHVQDFSLLETAFRKYVRLRKVDSDGIQCDHSRIV